MTPSRGRRILESHLNLDEIDIDRAHPHAGCAKISSMAIDDGFEALLEPFYNGKRLTDPISTKEDKFQLLPAFLKVKGECLLLGVPLLQS